jgi:hypothetical protein
MERGMYRDFGIEEFEVIVEGWKILKVTAMAKRQASDDVHVGNTCLVTAESICHRMTVVCSKIPFSPTSFSSHLLQKFESMLNQGGKVRVTVCQTSVDQSQILQ